MLISVNSAMFGWGARMGWGSISAPHPCIRPSKDRYIDRKINLPEGFLYQVISAGGMEPQLRHPESREATVTRYQNFFFLPTYYQLPFLIIYRVFRKKCFFTIHCNPSLAYTPKVTFKALNAMRVYVTPIGR